MLTFVLKPSSSSETPGFEAVATDVQGHEYSIVGTYELRDTDNALVQYSFTQTYPAGDDEEVRILYFHGTLDEDGVTFSGTWGPSEDDCQWPFYFSRLPQQVLLCRPSPHSFERHRIRTLWRFALSASLDEARHSLFSWTYMKDRRAARMEYQEILGRQTEGSLTEQDYRRMLILHRRLTYDDVRRCYAEEERRQPYANVLLW